MSSADPAVLTFDGRVALVTGAASGIGRASALAFARAGARVVVADIDQEGGDETVALITESGGSAIYVRTDVSRSHEVEALIRRTVDQYGRLDYAHNNAGIIPYSMPIDEYPEDLWDSTIEVNLKGTWLCLKHEIRQMRSQGNGAIVNTSSVMGLHGQREAAAYVASKHGVVGLTRVAALECAPDKIRVNAVCPSWVHTPTITGLFALAPLLEERFTALEPMGRLGMPEDVANAVVWLCSDAAAFVTGHSLVIDGGLTV